MGNPTGPLAYFNARDRLRSLFPQMKSIAKEAGDFIRAADLVLREKERAGADTSCARAALIELSWRVGSATEIDAAVACLNYCRTLVASTAPAPVTQQDDEGSFGPCVTQWFLKLDRSTDQLLHPADWPRAKPFDFLRKIDAPEVMEAYLERLVQSDLPQGRDNRKELNLTVSVISRLVLRGGIDGRLAGPRFTLAFRDFLNRWQDPQTGFFCVSYVDGAATIKTIDLSLTFHMARYLKGAVDYWPQLIQTLLDTKDAAYPQGWLDGGVSMTNHNNYDVAELFRLGWNAMSDGQRIVATTQIQRMLNWCLTMGLTSQGEVIDYTSGDSLPDCYYFAAAFLVTIGYFGTSRPFWSDTSFPQAQALRGAMLARLQDFNQQLPEVIRTKEILSAPDALLIT
ncbi:hypothetical protein SAMN05519103_02595 [Rhizobiales bacterium GAS113]|nr:hypothetical protein SAMN05519103_02595 [Rhizobiales bacterium GAS113]